MSTRPVVLCILDGFGHREAGPDNAITLAKTPTFDRLWREGPHAMLATSGAAVGLPPGQMGNSEVGHMNIGAGRIATPDLPRIDAAIADGSLAMNQVLLDLLAKVKAAGGRLHLLGLLSPGGVHSHQDHIIALARFAAGHGVEVFIHPFLDGRDTPPQSAKDYLVEVLAGLADVPGARIATLGGRYFGMDRDQRWDRLAKALDVIIDGAGDPAPNALGALEQAYARGETDEFVTPVTLGAYDGMRDGDGLLMANFRADRARQILSALVDPSFNAIPNLRHVAFSAKAGMVEYAASLNPFLPAIFSAISFPDTLGDVVAQAGLKQLRLAETEKFAHVTYFLNGGIETVFDGEDRVMIASPKVATYDLAPRMSADQVTDHLVQAIEGGGYDLIVVNYANGDMVGHTGDLHAAIQAVETLDRAMARVLASLDKTQGAILITADHGNAEMMRDPITGAPHTAHTIFDVPVFLYGDGARDVVLVDGKLADVAPTVLDLMGLAKPKVMTGSSLRHATSPATARRALA